MRADDASVSARAARRLGEWEGDGRGCIFCNFDKTERGKYVEYAMKSKSFWVNAKGLARREGWRLSQVVHSTRAVNNSRKNLHIMGDYGEACE
jgi:hypothetical protein